jgi:hypothetical protein
VLDARGQTEQHQEAAGCLSVTLRNDSHHSNELYKRVDMSYYPDLAALWPELTLRAAKRLPTSNHGKPTLTCTPVPTSMTKHHDHGT